jgi:hypothetical protein
MEWWKLKKISIRKKVVSLGLATALSLSLLVSTETLAATEVTDSNTSDMSRKSVNTKVVQVGSGTVTVKYKESLRRSTLVFKQDYEESFSTNYAAPLPKQSGHYFFKNKPVLIMNLDLAGSSLLKFQEYIQFYVNGVEIELSEGLLPKDLTDTVIYLDDVPPTGIQPADILLAPNWCSPEIAYLANYDFIRGDSEGRLRIGDSITRAEFATMVYRLFESKLSFSEPVPKDFHDMTKAHWAYGSVNFLQKVGVLTGDENNKFNPDNYISREEAIVILERAINQNESKEYLSVDDEIDKMKNLLEEKNGFAVLTDELRQSIDFNMEQIKLDFNTCNMAAAKERSVALMNFISELSINENEFNLEYYIFNYNKSTLGKFLKIIEEEMSLMESIPQYSDKDEINSWAKEYVDRARLFRSISGYSDNSFKPKNSISRAEVFKLLYSYRMNRGLDTKMNALTEM